MPAFTVTPENTLPDDHRAAALAGRVWRPEAEGPSVVAIRSGEVVDITRRFPTMRDLCETADPAARPSRCRGRAAWRSRRDPRQHPARTRNTAQPWLLAPLDLQAVKAAGVTFADLHAGARHRGAGARQPGGCRGRSAPNSWASIGTDLPS